MACIVRYLFPVIPNLLGWRGREKLSVVVCSSITQLPGCQPAWIIDIYLVGVPLTDPRETSQSLCGTGAAVCTISTVHRYCQPPLATPCCHLTWEGRPPSLSRCAARLSSDKGCPSCIYSSDPCLKMWTPARAWMSFCSTVDLFLEPVTCQNPFLLQLTGIGIKGQKFGLAHSLVNFNRKLQLIVGYSTPSLQGLLLQREKIPLPRDPQGAPNLTRPYLQGASRSLLFSEVPGSDVDSCALEVLQSCLW